MPNPLSRVNPKASIAIGPDGVANHPELARHVSRIIGQWAHVEVGLGLTLAALLWTKAHIGASLYNGLSGGTARRTVLESAARAALKDADHLLLRAVFKLSSASRRERNAIVHHLWTYSEALPDALLLIPPEKWLAFRSTITQNLLDPASSQPIPFIVFEEVQVYTIPELARISRRITNVVKYLAWFRELLTAPPIRSAAAREQLGNEPAILEAVLLLRPSQSPRTNGNR